MVLPERRGAKPWTGPYVSHGQLTQTGPPELTGRLAEWVRQLPGVLEGPSEISDPANARAFVTRTIPGAELPDDLEGERAHAFFLDRDAPADVLLMPLSGKREFAHVHDDGSLHVALSTAMRAEVLMAGWGERHPYSSRTVNITMVFGPRDEQELAVVRHIVQAAYDYATGGRVDSGPTARLADRSTR